MTFIGGDKIVMSLNSIESLYVSIAILLLNLSFINCCNCTLLISKRLYGMDKIMLFNLSMPYLDSVHAFNLKVHNAINSNDAAV